MEFHLRDPNMLQKLIDATRIGIFSSKEHYGFIWDGHGTKVYDITPSVHTLHLLTKSCGTDTLSHLLKDWKVMRNIKLTICNNHDTIAFLPGGIISVHSHYNSDKVFHAGKSQEVNQLLEFLQQG